MTILSISGSSRPDSSNTRLLEYLTILFPQKKFQLYQALNQLPLFQANEDKYPWPDSVLNWREALAQSDALIISTPEYLHNIPAILKNAFEWVNTSGELYEKPVLAITFTPNEPRGEKAMQSLLWSLQALKARVVGQLPLYQNEIRFEEDGIKMETELKEILEEAIHLLGKH